jgi:hypothetical protein
MVNRRNEFGGKRGKGISCEIGGYGYCIITGDQMQITLKTISWLKVFLFICLFLGMTTISTGQPESAAISGTILININSESKFTEFKLQNGNLLKTTEGKPILIDKERNTYIDCSDNFRNIYNHERLYYYKMEEKLAAILSKYDLERLDNLRRRLKSQDSLNAEKFFLTGPGIKFQFFTGKYTGYFLPNRQFSHVVFHHAFATTGAIIDLNSKEISFPFDLDRIKNIVWNNEGQYLAYSTPDKGDESQSILVLKRIDKGNTLLRKDIGKYVSDITWSSDSLYVALLTYTGRIGFLPWELLALWAGHPVFNSTFNLEIYDVSGNCIYHRRIEDNFKKWSGHSKGRMVWSP